VHGIVRERSRRGAGNRPPQGDAVTVDLGPRFVQWSLPVRAQGNRPTCSVFTVAGALEFARAAATGDGVCLSVDFLNWGVRQVTGRAEDGGLFSEVWEAYRRFGACTEAEVPYGSGADPGFEPAAASREGARTAFDPGLRLHWIKEWDVTTGLADGQLERIRATLRDGFPVCGGFRWPKRQQWVGGVLAMCAADEVYDGHSVLIRGYHDDAAIAGGGAVMIRNSGGTSREGSLPYAYLSSCMNDAAWIGPVGKGTP
jgi:hypothetical protein